MVTFDAKAAPQPPRLTRNLNKVDWDLFRGEVEERVASRVTEMDLHEKASFLVDAINQTLDKQAPPQPQNPNPSQGGGPRNLEI